MKHGSREMVHVKLQDNTIDRAIHASKTVYW